MKKELFYKILTESETFREVAAGLLSNYFTMAKSDPVEDVIFEAGKIGRSNKIAAIKFIREQSQKGFILDGLLVHFRHLFQPNHHEKLDRERIVNAHVEGLPECLSLYAGKAIVEQILKQND